MRVWPRDSSARDRVTSPPSPQPPPQSSSLRSQPLLQPAVPNPPVGTPPACARLETYARRSRFSCVVLWSLSAELAKHDAHNMDSIFRMDGLTIRGTCHRCKYRRGSRSHHNLGDRLRAQFERSGLSGQIHTHTTAAGVTVRWRQGCCCATAAEAAATTTAATRCSRQSGVGGGGECRQVCVGCHDACTECGSSERL